MPKPGDTCVGCRCYHFHVARQGLCVGAGAMRELGMGSSASCDLAIPSTTTTITTRPNHLPAVPLQEPAWVVRVWVPLLPFMAGWHRFRSKSRWSIVHAWELAQAGGWDTAIAGSSSLRAGIVRIIRDECDASDGLYCASLLWDCDKLYDTIRLLDLVRAAVQVGFPLREFL